MAVSMTPASAYPPPGRTERISVAADGTEGNDESARTAISADGRHVAFRSLASNLVPGDTNGVADIFVHDRATAHTERVSVASDGTEGNGDSEWFRISANARFVAFESKASNLVPGDTNGRLDAFVHDRTTGATERVSVASDGAQGNRNSGNPALSADGRYVAFWSLSSNLTLGDTNGFPDVFVHDRETGVTERVSLGNEGTQGNQESGLVAISPEGRHVAFASLASNLIADDTNRDQDIFVHDRETGVTERVSVSSDGTQGSGFSQEPTISADGRYVAFWSIASNLVPGDVNGNWDVFVHDRSTKATERVSVSSDGIEGNQLSGFPFITPDGRYVAYWSFASNLDARDANGNWDIFVRDRETGVTEQVSVTSDGTPENQGSYHPSISADGHYVSFMSLASNLVPGDTNEAWDVFVRDRGPAVGVGELSAVPEGDDVSASGWVRFSGQEIASAADPPDDAPTGAPAGAELSGASLTYRTEGKDLLVRLRLSSLPLSSPGVCVMPINPCVWGNIGGAAPGVLYGLEFDVDGVRYEIRSLRAGATGNPPAAPLFALYRCDPNCTEQTRLTGGIGTTGTEVVVSVPLAALGSSEGATLEGIRAFTAVGEAALGPVLSLDEVDIPDGTVPEGQVRLGIAPAGTPEEEVPLDTQVTLADGLFSGTVEVSSLPPGDYEVWARACLGKVCAAVSKPVLVD